MSGRSSDRTSSTARARSTRALGRIGEELAARYLSDQGLRIVARNIHLRHAEIDLIALDGDTLCFVEIRLRSSARFGSAAESVDSRKQRRIARAAAQLLASGELPRAARIRFDVVALDGSPDNPTIQHIRDAFTS